MSFQNDFVSNSVIMGEAFVQLGLIIIQKSLRAYDLSELSISRYKLNTVNTVQISDGYVWSGFLALGLLYYCCDTVAQNVVEMWSVCRSAQRHRCFVVFD